MDDDAVAAAERRLVEARSTMQALSATLARGPYDPHAWRAAANAELAAERDVARAKHRQYAIELTLDFAWDAGAPLPFLVSNGLQAAVICYLQNDGDEAVGVLEFHQVHHVKFGGLNDEALEGHPLYGAGLAMYGAHEVIASEWIAEEERRNSVHRSHRGGWHDRKKHFVMCFHDETLECIAKELRAYRHAGSYGDVVQSVTARLIGGS